MAPVSGNKYLQWANAQVISPSLSASLTPGLQAAARGIGPSPPPLTGGVCKTFTSGPQVLVCLKVWTSYVNKTKFLRPRPKQEDQTEVVFQAQHRETIDSIRKVSVSKIIMTTSVTKSCFTRQRETCKTKRKTMTDFWYQTGLVLRPTVIIVIVIIKFL